MSEVYTRRQFFERFFPGGEGKPGGEIEYNSGGESSSKQLLVTRREMLRYSSVLPLIGIASLPIFRWFPFRSLGRLSALSVSGEEESEALNITQRPVF